MSHIPTFQEFLERNYHLPSEIRVELLSLTENKLSDFLRGWVDAEFGNVWDDRYDSEYYEAARRKINGNQACKDTTPDFTLYNQALVQVAGYLRHCNRLTDFGSTGRKRKKPENTVAETIPEPAVPELTEGEMSEMHVVKRERNQEARRLCISHYRTLHAGRLVCECCGFDFVRTYGKLGEDYMEIHHLSPISQQDEAHGIDPEKDLVPLCANCHAMIHRYLNKNSCEGMESLEGLRAIVKENGENT